MIRSLFFLLFAPMVLLGQGTSMISQLEDVVSVDPAGDMLWISQPGQVPQDRNITIEQLLSEPLIDEAIARDAELATHTLDQANPHNVTAAQLGLGSSDGPTFGSVTAPLVSLGNGELMWEGSVVDGLETRISVINPTVDRLITFPDADGTVALKSQLFDSQWSSLVNTPTSLAGYGIADAATAAQGALADTAVQPNTAPELDGVNIADVDARMLSGAGARGFYSGNTGARLHLDSVLGEALSGARKHLNVWLIGDSLAHRTAGHVIEQGLRNWFNSEQSEVWGMTAVDGGDPLSGFGALGGGPITIDGGSWVVKNDYTFNYTGSYVDLLSGSLRFAKSTATIPFCDRILIPYKITPGGGVFKVQVSTTLAAYQDTGHASWVDPAAGEVVSSHTLTGSELLVDTNAPLAMGVIELDFASTMGRTIQLVHESGGAVRLGQPAFFIENEDAVNTYWMGEGSNNFLSIDPAVTPLMTTFCGAMKPDVIFVHSDDDWAGYAKLLESLRTVIDDSGLGYAPLVVLIGHGPQEAANDDERIKAANDFMAGYAAANGMYFIDGTRIAHTWDEIVDAGWQGGDGIHIAPAWHLHLAEMIIEELGLDAYPVAADPVLDALDVYDGQALADDWEARVSVASGVLTAQSMRIATALSTEIYRLGLRDKIDYLLPLLGADLDAMTVPLIDDYGVGNATPNALTDAEVGEGYGFQKATGTDHYLDLHLGAAHADAASSWGVYFTGRTAGYPLGMREGTNATLGWTNDGLHPLGTNNSHRWIEVDYPEEFFADGLHIIMNDGGSGKWYLDGALVGQRTTLSSPIAPSQALRLGAMYYQPWGTLETDAAIGFFFKGKALSGVEVERLSAAIESVVIQELGR